MNKVLLLITFLCSSIVLGQDHSVGFSFGGSNANITRSGYDFYQSVSGLSFNGNYTLQKNKFFAKSSVGFQQKGFSIEITYVDEFGAILGEGAIETTRFSYLGGPQLVGIQFGDKVYGTFALGVDVSFYLNTKVKSDQFELNNGSLAGAYSYTLSNLTPMDLAGVAESSVGFQVNEMMDVLLSASYNYGFVGRNYKSNPSPDPWLNRYLSVRFGVRFHLEGNEDEI
jgi:hypothetical protein